MKRLLSVLLAVLMVFTLFGCGNGNSDPTPTPSKKVLRVGMECDYAPNNWQEEKATDSNLPISNLDGFYAEGYDVQMAKNLASQMGYEVEIVKLTWEGLIPALNQETIDVIIAGMADTEERRQSINFTDYYSVKETEYCVVVRNDGNYANISSIADLTGAAVLGQKGTRYDEVIDQISGVNHVEAVPTTAAMISRLAESTVDALVFDTETAEAFLQSYTEFKVVRFEAGKGFNIGFKGGCIGVKFGREDLVDELNKALANIPTETRQQYMDNAQATMPR